MRSVVVGGAGQVGELFCRLLLQHGPVVSIDGGMPLAPGAESVTGDACVPTPEMVKALEHADTVVFALPEHIALKAARALTPAIRPGALLVETLSVQQVVTKGFTALAEERGAEVCGLNPMFAPSLGFYGNTVAAVPVVDGPRTRELLETISTAGAQVIRLQADEHDRITAVLQAATHAAVLAFGSVVAELGGSPDALIALAPPPHLTMLALLARITGGNLDVYWDIQAANPSAADARAALSEAVTVLDKLASVGDRDRFWEWVRRIDDHLGDQGPKLRDRCARLFAGEWTT